MARIIGDFIEGLTESEAIAVAGEYGGEPLLVEGTEFWTITIPKDAAAPSRKELRSFLAALSTDAVSIKQDIAALFVALRETKKTIFAFKRKNISDQIVEITKRLGDVAVPSFPEISPFGGASGGLYRKPGITDAMLEIDTFDYRGGIYHTLPDGSAELYQGLSSLPLTLSKDDALGLAAPARAELGPGTQATAPYKYIYLEASGVGEGALIKRVSDNFVFSATKDFVDKLAADGLILIPTEIKGFSSGIVDVESVTSLQYGVQAAQSESLSSRATLIYRSEDVVYRDFYIEIKGRGPKGVIKTLAETPQTLTRTGKDYAQPARNFVAYSWGGAWDGLGSYDVRILVYNKKGIGEDVITDTGWLKNVVFYSS